MQVKKLCLYIILTLISVINVIGQYDCRIKKITVKDGLTHHTVKKIVVDSLGFLWMGTEAGLNRFDGYKMKAYFKDEDNPNSLSDDMINDLFVDSEGNLWIGASKSPICRLDLATEKFTIYEKASDNDVSLGVNHRIIVEDNRKTIWFAGNENSGVASYNLLTGYRNIYKHSDKENSISGNSVLSLMPDGDILWIGKTNGFIDKLNRRENKIENYRLKDLHPDFNEESIVWFMFKDSGNNFLVSVDNGIYLFNEDARYFKKMLHSPAPKTHFISGFVNVIKESKDRIVWFGTDKGLFAYNINNNEFRPLNNLNPFKDRIGGRSVLSLCEDKSGMMYATVYGKEVFLIDRTIKAFNGIDMVHKLGAEETKILVRSIGKDANGNILIGTIRDGLYIYKEKQLVNHYKSNFNKAS